MKKHQSLIFVFWHNIVQEPEKIVFHVVTDSLNFPAISMWFLLNPPGKATIQIQSIDNFGWLFTKYHNPTLKQESSDSRFTFQLNHLRFYLPEVFPALDRIVLLDHDVVVQRDLSGLWDLDMQGKVIGAVETCQKRKNSYRRMDTFVNFSDPFVAKSFDINACTWAFGLNLFDLQQWRKHDLTAVYHRYLRMVHQDLFLQIFSSTNLNVFTFNDANTYFYKPSYSHCSFSEWLVAGFEETFVDGWKFTLRLGYFL